MNSAMSSTINSTTNSTINSTTTAASLCCTFIFIGNPSRGDDAIGPILFQEMEDWLNQTDIKNRQLINTFQLEPELCCDIENTEVLILVDASTIKADAPWIEKLPDNELPSSQKPGEPSPLPVWTHSMPPASLLMLFTQIYHKSAPTSYTLHIPGLSFELGAALSPQVSDYKIWCLDFLKKCCQVNSRKELQALIKSAPNA